MHAPVRRLCSAMLPVLALSLTACASRPLAPPGALPPVLLPPPPSLTTPLPPVSYSLTASERIRSWHDRLMATPLMRAPSETPGR